MAGKWRRRIYPSRRVTVPAIDEEKEKLRAHKTWYTSLYDKLFGENHQKQKKIEKLLYNYDMSVMTI